jgi:tetratricopeptide (TPR) repeat protein
VNPASAELLAERRRERLEPAALAAGVFAVYAWGACRTVFVGYSGDLATAVSVLGIPHPSGYPLYVLGGWLWSRLLFFLTLPLALSLFSAAAAAAASGVLYRVVREEGLGRAPALFSALLFAFGPSLWGEANIQRVYALNALFVAAATLFALRWRRGRRTADLAAAFLLCGLGASNHLYMAVFGAALAAFAAMDEPAILRRPRTLLVCAAAAFAGLLPYVYLPMRARANPVLAWGDPRSAGSLVRVVLREDFWGRRFLAGPSDLGIILRDYAASLFRETAWVGPPLAALALAFAFARRRKWPWLLPVLAMAGNFFSMALHGSRSDLFIWHRYYIPSYFFVALMAGWGCAVALGRGPRPALLRALVLLPPAALAVSGFARFDRSRYRVAEDYAQIILTSLPPGSHLIAADDNILFGLMYLNLGAGERPDVDLILEGVGGARLPSLAFNPDRDPVFVTHYPNWNVRGLEMAPVGLLFRPWRAGRPWPPPLPVPARLDGEEDPRVPKEYLTQNLIGNFHYMRGVTFERTEWISARREFALAAAAAPDNDVLFYNLGLIFSRDGLYEDALAAFRRSAEINPREIASLSKPRAADRVREVEVERGRIEKLEAELTAGAPGPPQGGGSAADHRRRAALLVSRGEEVAARGHLLRAEEAEQAEPAR